jgi:hypothetical protein
MLRPGGACEVLELSFGVAPVFRLVFCIIWFLIARLNGFKDESAVLARTTEGGERPIMATVRAATRWIVGITGVLIARLEDCIVGDRFKNEPAILARVAEVGEPSMLAAVGALSWWWLVITSSRGLTPVIIVLGPDSRRGCYWSSLLLGRTGVMAFLRALVSAIGVAEEIVVRTDGGILEWDLRVGSRLTLWIYTRDSAQEESAVEGETSSSALDFLLSWEK